MDVYNDDKLKAMEDEMNRFEEEIGLPIIPPPPPPPLGVMNAPTVIGANTYNTVQRQLEEQQHVGPGMAAMAMPGFPAVVGIPPPPPPPPMLVPHQVRVRAPIRHPMRPMGMAPNQGPGGPVIGPGPGFLPPPQGGPSGPPGPPFMPPMGPAGIMPVQPMPSVVSATPMMYPAQVSEPQIPPAVIDPIMMSSPEMPSMTPLTLPTDASTPSTSIEPILDRRNKPKPRPLMNHAIPAPPVVPMVPTLTTEETATSKKKKNKKLIRTAGGQTWEDPSLGEWEDDDFRLFCGDLGNDVTDEILVRVFSKYPSFLKAKVVRDKRTNKTKGFGFVSFKDPQDFIKAMKEMNGRYVGSRPIKLRKSTWRNRSMETVRKKEKEKAALIGLLTGR